MMNSTGEQTLGAIYHHLYFRLGKNSQTPGLDAQKLLAHVLERPSSWILAHPEMSLAPVPAALLENLVARMDEGEPLPYVLGLWEFFGQEYEVTSDVLIPRPETELMVERAIAWLGRRENLPGEPAALDVGTGSGCIAIALALNVARLRVTATDISAAALAVAGRNAQKLHVSNRISFIKADLIPDSLVPATFSLIVANLPYIPTATLRGLPIFMREPTLALDGGVDGLGLVRRLIMEAPERLNPGGLLLMEIEASQGPAALSLAWDVFSEAEIHLHKDLAGRDRILEIQA
jgi:release factor glutamine methyltransferase